MKEINCLNLGLNCQRYRLNELNYSTVFYLVQSKNLCHLSNPSKSVIQTMRFAMLILVFISTYTKVSCQKERNATWILGNRTDGNQLQFNDSLKILLINPGIDFAGSNSSISDLDGKLLFYTNSCWVANKEFKLMKNGDTINPGAARFGECDLLYGPSSPGCVITEYPGRKDWYFIFNIDIDIPYYGIDSFAAYTPQRVMYHVVDMTRDSGRGEVILKNQIAFYDTLGRASLVACRHDNKKDFWLIAPKSHTNCYFVFLINENGVNKPSLQCFGERWSDLDSQGQAVFSPNGKHYARMNKWNGLNIYDFNNSTGLLSNPRPRITFDQDTFHVAGLSFSPNSRYLYASALTKVIQYDMNSPDISSSRTVIALYDGFRNPYGTVFYLSALAPDGRIYISATSSTYNLHVITKPDCPGSASEIIQHGIALPGFNFSSVPTQPHYGYEASTYICDSTLNGLKEDLTSKRLFDIYPSSVSNKIIIKYNGNQFSGNGTAGFTNLTGKQSIYPIANQTFNELDISELSSGIYIVQIIQNKKVIYQSKLVKLDSN